MALTRLPSFTLLNTDSYTFGNANISGNITAGNLKTDHLLYANGSPYVFTTSAAGSNTQLQFNDGGSFAGSANLTFNKTTNTLSVTTLAVSGNVTAGNLTTSGTSGNISGANNITANFFIGNGASLSAIAGANVTGAVSYATTANSVAAANVSGLGNLALLNKDGNASNILYGNGVFAGAPVTYNNSSVATYLASFGSNSISTTGNVSVGNITVGGNLTVNGTLTSINSTIVEIDDLAIVLANDASSASQANGAGIIINGASANMLYVSTSNSFVFSHSISTSGNITAGNVITSGSGGNISGANTITANYFVGNGASLSAIAGANVTGFVPNANVANTAYSVAVANVTGIGNIATINKDGNASNILYGNGVFASAPVTYGNSNVATFLASFGSNTITTTGNVTVGNIIATNIGNIAALNKDGNASNVLFGNGVFAAAPSTPNPGTAIGVDNFTGDGTTTTFTLSSAPAGVNNVIINYNGAFVSRSSYSVSGTTLTFGSAPANGSKIEVSTISGLGTGTASFSTRTYTGDGTTVNYTVSAGLTVSTVLATLDGVLQTPTSDYTISGTTLTFITAPYNGATIQIRELGVAVAATSGAITVKDEGTTLSNLVTSIDFVGSSVTATNVGGAVTVSVSGSSNATIRAQSMVMGIIFGG